MSTSTSPAAPTSDDERPAWKQAFIAFGASTLLFVAVGIVLPKSFDVTRTREIAAPANRVFDAVADLRQFAEWNPWVQDDPGMQISFGETTRGVGAEYSWQSDQHGGGSMTITALETGRSIATHLDFGDQGGAIGRFEFEALTDSVTRVTWGISGDLGANPLMGWMALMMDSMTGKDFESGLDLLAERVESR